jgi:hypothetical protein
MLASNPASMVNQKHTDLGIPNRFNLTPSRFSPGMTIESVAATEVCYRIGGAYCTPPAFHSWFMPRGIFSLDFSPMLRSYISP